MDIYSILEKKSCAIGLRPKSKDEALRSLADLAAQSGRINAITADEIYRLLSDRESQGSTGFGNEIAIPHARVEGMEEFLLFVATVPRGVEFDALDKKKVRIFFVILGPAEAVNEHLKILAFVSRALGHTNVKNELIQSSSVTSLYEAFLRNTTSETGEKKEQRKMQMLLLNLYDEDLLYPILEVFIEEGIEGATILDSAGMGRYISNVPLFADFIGFMRQNKNQSKTILTLVAEENLHGLVSHIEDVTGDLDKKQGAMIMVLDIAFMKGTMKML